MLTELSEDYVTVELIITSNKLTSDEITRRIGLRCDENWKIGDPRGKTGKQWESHGWVIREAARSRKILGESATSLLPQCLGNIISRLKPILNNIEHLSDKTDIGLSIGVSSTQIPGLTFEAETISVIHAIGAWLDIDVTLC